MVCAVVSMSKSMKYWVPVAARIQHVAGILRQYRTVDGPRVWGTAAQERTTGQAGQQRGGQEQAEHPQTPSAEQGRTAHVLGTRTAQYETRRDESPAATIAIVISQGCGKVAPAAGGVTGPGEPGLGAPEMTEQSWLTV